MNLEPVAKCDGTVLIVNNQESQRNNYANCLKQLGFKKVQGVQNLKTSISYLESEEYHWIIAMTQNFEDVNLSTFLNLAKKHPKLLKIPVSPFLTEDDAKYIPHLAEMGCFLPIHLKTEVDQIKAELDFVINQCKTNKHPTEIMGLWLENFLKEKNNAEDHLSLLRSLASRYPTNGNILCKLGEAELKAGNKKSGGLALRQARLFDGVQYTETSQKIADQYLEGKLPPPQNTPNPDNLLGVRYCLVVGCEDEVKVEIEKATNPVGVPKEFADNEKAAFDIIGSKGTPDLVIVDWEMPDTHASVFLQNLRQAKHSETKVLVVYNEELDSADKAILRELGIFDLEKRPFETELLPKLVSVMYSNNNEFVAFAVYTKIVDYLKAGDLNQATEELQKFKRLEPLPKGLRELVNAEFAYTESEFEDARKFVYAAIRANANPVQTLSLLGRVLAKLGQFDESFECFDKAQALSPLNLDRLCQMSEMKYEEGDTEQAKELLSEAKEIGDSANVVQELEAKLDILIGESQKASASMGKLKGLENIVIFLNNRAVVAAKSGKFEECEITYSKAIEAIPAQHAKYRTILYYNLGLAYLRQNNSIKALESFANCKSEENPRIQEKAGRLIETINNAIDDGKELKVSGGDGQKALTQTKEALKELKKRLKEASAVDIATPGDRALWGLFETSVDRKKIVRLVKATPPFKEKSETKMGEKSVWL